MEDVLIPSSEQQQNSCYSSSSDDDDQENLASSFGATGLLPGDYSTRVRSSRLLSHLSTLPPSQNKKVLDALKKIKRLRIALPDPLRGVSAEYNRDAGNGTFADLVHRTEFTARTCVDSLLAMNQSMKSTFEHREALLRDLVEDALQDFFVELSVLVGECMGCSVLIFGKNIKLQDAIQCCMQVAHNHVMEAMGVPGTGLYKGL